MHRPEQAREYPWSEGEATRGSNFSPFTRRVATAVGLAAAIVVLLMFLWKVATVVLIVFAGILLAVILSGTAKRLSMHTPLPYGWSLLVTVTFIIGALVLLGWVLAPQISAQFRELSETLPQSIDRVEQQLRQYAVGQYLLEQTQNQDFVPGRSSIWSQATGVVSKVFDVLATFIVILMIGVYLAANPERYKKGLVMLVPVPKRERAHHVLDAVGYALWGWLMGTLVSMSIIGVLTWLGLMILGVPLALVLGVIAGLFEFVPLIGPWAAGILGVLVAFAASPDKVLYVALLYLGIQQLESNVITPLVMKEAVSLPPALTITATVMFAVLFGVFGVLIATPLILVTKVLVQKIYVEGVLGDPQPSVDPP